MPFIPSFVGKAFVVSDSDARIRDPNDLTTTTPKVIPKGTRVVVTEVKTQATGSKNRTVFANTTSTSGTVLGWTSTRNFDGSFINETLGLLPAGNNSNQKGPNGAWSNGNFIGVVDLVEIVDNTHEIERMTLPTVEPYLTMVAAAAAAGIHMAINSGFRSWPEQNVLFQGFTDHVPGFNRAAPPGFSNHQNGIALDIEVGGFGSAIYNWLTKNATSFGFIRTVSGEPWHWEHDPAKAATAKTQGTFKTANVSP